MKTIEIKTQAELDALPDKFEEYTEIRINGKFDIINLKLINNSFYSVRGGTINSVRGGTINSVGGGTINYVDGGTINSVRGGTIYSVEGGTINSVEGGTIYSVEGGTIYSVEGGTINYVRGGTINYVDGGTINSVEGGTINSVRGGTINSVGGNSLIKVYSEYCNIKKALQESVIIYIGCKGKPEKVIGKNVSILYKKIATYTKKDFTEIYSDNLSKDKKSITLYKSVNPDTFCDYHTGKIKYEIGKTVICPDFDKDINRECGGGLHLSPTPELTQRFNHGKILQCEVKLTDFVVYPKNIDKVRCKKVKVIKEANL